MGNLTQRVQDAFLKHRRKIVRGARIGLATAWLLTAGVAIAAPSYQDPTTVITPTSTITDTNPISPIYEEITKTICAMDASFSDHECDDSESHVLINGIPDTCEHPPSTHWYWDNGQDLIVPLDSSSGHMAHYRTDQNLDAKITDITAEICEQWDGQFVLSHGPCPPTVVCLSEFNAYSPAQSNPLQTDEPSTYESPEPGTVLLLGSGLAGLAGYAALRFRKK